MNSSDTYTAFVPVYDDLPTKWEDSRNLLVERLKFISNGVNSRVNGYFSDSEYASGKLYPPGIGIPPSFRPVIRKIINFNSLVIGLNTVAHGINFDANFTLTQLYAAATNAVAFNAIPIPNGANTITMDATNIYITVAAAYTRCYAVVEFMGEL